MLARLAQLLLRLPAGVVALSGKADAETIYQVGDCPVCGEPVSFYDNFISERSSVIHLGCVFAVAHELRVSADTAALQNSRP